MKIGIIGGSGLDNPNLLENYHEKKIITRYGTPSSIITCGKLFNQELYILARHGKNHEIPPSQINYRANISAMKELGCSHILATSAVGSLKEEIAPGDLVFPDQFIDFTKKRDYTFYDKIGEVNHLQCAEPFSENLREIFIKSAKTLELKYHPKGTILVFEGPRFSTKAESFFFRQFADILSMTAVPEVVLAREAGMDYAIISISTDYDCWKTDEEPVTWDMVKTRMNENAGKVKKILVHSIEELAGET